MGSQDIRPSHWVHRSANWSGCRFERHPSCHRCGWTSDIEGFLSFCTEDAEWNFVGEKILAGKPAIREYIAQTYGKPPKFDISDLIAENDFVTALGQITITGRRNSKLVLVLRRVAFSQRENGPAASLRSRKAMTLCASKVRSNTSLEPTRYGMRCKAGSRYSVHYRSVSLHRMPPRAAQLER